MRAWVLAGVYNVHSVALENMKVLKPCEDTSKWPAYANKQKDGKKLKYDSVTDNMSDGSWNMFVTFNNARSYGEHSIIFWFL